MKKIMKQKYRSSNSRLTEDIKISDIAQKLLRFEVLKTAKKSDLIAFIIDSAMDVNRFEKDLITRKGLLHEYKIDLFHLGEKIDGQR